ncbi:hypothetical protein EDD21DRAFT_115632 [Dissophora ornata]|nr:hypothetical protein EDD21DRAFT_115632 [Dissophora ornata]
MTTAASPVMSLAELARERSASNASKHAEYQDRAEPRSAMTMDYTSTTNNNTVRHQQPQHYNEEHGNQYPEEYHDQQQLQQQHYNNGNSNNSNGYSHPSALPPSSQPHYPHGSAANGSYPPPPIQTTQFGNGSGGNSVHPHAQNAMHNSFASPTSPALSPSPLSPGNHNPYQQQQQPQQGHYEYDQYHPQSYHAHHTPYPQDHHPHPLSPNADGSGPGQFYPSYSIPVGGKVDDVSNGNSGYSANGTALSNGSYSSSASSTHYPR